MFASRKFFLVLLFLTLSVRSLQADYPPSEEAADSHVYQDHVFDAIFLGANPYFVQNFDLGSVREGEWQRVSVGVKNLSTQPFAFDSVSLSCACTTAKVPKETLQVGDVQVATFAFPIENIRGSLEHGLSATILASGSAKRIVFTFKYRVTEVAKFATNPVGFKISDDNGLLATSGTTTSNDAKFEIPLLLDDLNLRSRLRIETSGDLPVRFIDVIERDGNAIARVSIDSALVSPDGCNGELILISPYGRDSVPGTIFRESLVTLHPSLISFSVENGNEQTYVASALAKIRSERKADNQLEQSEIESVKIIARENAIDKFEIDVEPLRLSRGIYRLNFKAKLQDSAAENLPNKLRVEVTTKQGVYPVDAMVSWGG